MPEIELVGLDKLQGLLKAIGDQAPVALGAALYAEATAVLGQSQKIVPVKLGHLRDSGTVSDPSYSQNGVEVTIGYGGPAVDYALEVHENLDAHHKPGQQAKYLEQPTLEAVPNMGDRMAETVQSRIERGIT